MCVYLSVCLTYIYVHMSVCIHVYLSVLFINRYVHLSRRLCILIVSV